MRGWGTHQRDVCGQGIYERLALCERETARGWLPRAACRCGAGQGGAALWTCRKQACSQACSHVSLASLLPHRPWTLCQSWRTFAAHRGGRPTRAPATGAQVRPSMRSSVPHLVGDSSHCTRGAGAGDGSRLLLEVQLWKLGGSWLSVPTQAPVARACHRRQAHVAAAVSDPSGQRSARPSAALP